jgi:glycosyltransferase involved in cell wall biosynthesis
VKHIAFIIPGLDRIGGAEQQMLLLAHGLRRHRWRVSVVALSGFGGSAGVELAADGIAFMTLKMRKGLADPRGWFKFHGWLCSEQPAIVHAHLPHAVWLARWSRLVAPMQVLVDTLHTSSTGSLGRKLGYRWSSWLPDQVTAVSHAVAQTHFAASMVGMKDLRVLPNGVDVDLWAPNAAVRADVRKENHLEDEFLWFAAGRLEPVKDYPTLLRAMVHLPERARLVIAGGGRLQSELGRMRNDLGLESRVRFLGFTADVRAWMQAADGFVLSSRLEGLPMSLLEAGACALPVAATDVPGTRDVILDGQNGLLAEAGSARALGQAMMRLMESPLEERSAMGERARQHVLDHFSLDAVLNQWETLYDDLLALNPRSRRWRARRASAIPG